MDQSGEHNNNFKNWRSKNNYYYTRRSKLKYPERTRARQVVYRAIKSGKLKAPDYCQGAGCSNTENLTCHHEFYEYPLLVMWLCPACHRKADKARKEREKNQYSHKFIEQRKPIVNNSIQQQQLGLFN